MKQLLSYFFILALLCLGSTSYARAEKRTLPETPSAANTGLLSGKVTDATGSPLPGAVLRLDKYNRYTISGTDGSYAFLNVPADTYQMTVNYIGFKKETISVTVYEGKNTSVMVRLKEDVSLLKGVVITAFQNDQARALNRQKTNNNISNVISSDLVERFPDANMGDALKRVAGITVQNDQGEARNIIVRGLSPELNSVSLNGNRIPSAEGDNRNVQMDLIPVELISAVMVSKTLLPDMDADAIGGSINLETRTPSRERLSIGFTPGYNPIRSSMTYAFSFLYGNRFLDDKLGLVATLAYQQRDYGSDNIEAEWEKDKNDLSYVYDFQIRKYDVFRARRAATLGADYRFNANNKLKFSATYSWRDDRENRFRVRSKGIKPVYDKKTNELQGFTAKSIERQTKGGIDDSRNKNRRLEDQRMMSFTLKGDHLLGEKLNFKWESSFSKASEDRPHERYMTYRQKKVDGTFRMLGNDKPIFEPQGEALDQMKLKEISQEHRQTNETEWAFRADARTPFSLIPDQKGRLRLGLRLRLKEKMRDNNYFEYEPTSDTYALLSQVDQVEWKGENFAPGSEYVPGTFADASLLGGLDLENGSLFKKEDRPEEYYAANYKAHEKIYAAYLRYDQNISSKLSFITGLRMEKTVIDYLGHTFVDEKASGDVSKTNSYINWLPNLTVKYQASDRWILRGAYSTAIARPNYYALVPYRVVSSKDNKIGAGNPDLKPTRSHNFDLMSEYYFSSLGLFSGGLFYKRLEHYIYKYRVSNMSAQEFDREFPELSNPITPDSHWSYSTSKNGSYVDVFGFECSLNHNFAFLPGSFFKHLNGTVNYTYTRSKAYGATDEDGNERPDVSLPRTAPHMFNASLAWENKRFDARVSFNYTADYLDELGQNSYYDIYYDKQMFLDINIGYHPARHWNLFFEAKNLTNQPLRYYQAKSDHMVQLEYYRPNFNLGIKYTL